MTVASFEGKVPVIGPETYIHPSADVFGDIEIGRGCWIGPGKDLLNLTGTEEEVQGRVVILISVAQDEVVEREINVFPKKFRAGSTGRPSVLVAGVDQPFFRTEVDKNRITVSDVEKENSESLCRGCR